MFVLVLISGLFEIVTIHCLVMSQIVLFTNEHFKDGNWKVSLLPYYTQFQKEASIETVTKNIQVVYLDGAPATQTVKNWFGKSHRGDFSLNNQTYSRQPSNIDEDTLLVIVEIKQNFQWKGLLRVWKSTAFWNLKRLGLKKHVWYCKSKRQSKTSCCKTNPAESY